MRVRDYIISKARLHAENCIKYLEYGSMTTVPSNRAMLEQDAISNSKCEEIYLQLLRRLPKEALDMELYREEDHSHAE